MCACLCVWCYIYIHAYRLKWKHMPIRNRFHRRRRCTSVGQSPLQNDPKCMAVPYGAGKNIMRLSHTDYFSRLYTDTYRYTTLFQTGHECFYIWMHVCVLICIYICISVNMMRIIICLYIHICVCITIYIYVYLYWYLYLSICKSFMILSVDSKVVVA